MPGYLKHGANGWTMVFAGLWRVTEFPLEAVREQEMIKCAVKATEEDAARCPFLQKPLVRALAWMEAKWELLTLNWRNR